MTERTLHKTNSRPVASHPGGGGGSELGWVEHYKARIQDFLGGGGGEDIHKHTPLGQCPRDVIRPPEN